MKYICYLSFGKIENLYSQISEFTPTKVQRKKTTDVNGKAEISVPPIFSMLKGNLSFGAHRGGELIMEGEINPLQKLNKIIQYLEQEKLIGNLNKSIEEKKVDVEKICYSYTGNFCCKANIENINNSDFFSKEEQDADYPMKHRSGLKVVSSMTTLFSDYLGYTLVLAASYKYFSDMGGGRVKVGEDYSDNDLVSIHPHSGNHHFFSGYHNANFETILFVSGQKGKILYCSPLVIVNSFTPDLTL